MTPLVLQASTVRTYIKQEEKYKLDFAELNGFETFAFDKTA